jgi:hypothetical protein
MNHRTLLNEPSHPVECRVVALSSCEHLRCGTGAVKLRLQQATLPPVATSVLFALGLGLVVVALYHEIKR